MFFSPYRHTLEAMLREILAPNSAIKSSTLLQAYATFSAAKQKELSDFSAALNEVYQENQGCYYALLPNLPKQISSKIPAAVEAFLAVSADDFLRFITPDLISEPSRFLLFFRDNFEDNIILLTHHVMQIRRVSFQKAERNSSSFEDNVDPFRIIYKAYSALERNESIRLSYSLFREFYEYINLHLLDLDELKRADLKRLSSKTEKNLDTIVNAFMDQLELSRESQIEIAYKFFAKGEQAPQLSQLQKVYPFMQVKDVQLREKILRKGLAAMAAVSPMEALCAIVTSKKAGMSQGKNRTEGTILSNDVSLENGLIYSLFSSTFLPIPNTEELGCFVFFPSPFFVRKWINDQSLKHQKVTFIFKNEIITGLISHHYSQGTYAGNLGKNVLFLPYEEWKNRFESNKAPFQKMLLFACGLSQKEQDNWYEVIKKSSSPLDIFVLLAAHEFEAALSPFSSELEDPRIRMEAIALIPQGINNSTFPRRKLFLRLAYDPAGTTAVPERSAKIVAYTLNTDLKRQALARTSDAPIEIPQCSLANLDRSVRDLYRQEILKRKASGRKNMAAFSYQFTPDLTIWCSKSYPTKNNSRPRLEAYFCLPADSEKARRGFRDRGNIIGDTRKHTTRIPDSGVFSWLEDEYPFSSVQARYSSKEQQNMPSPPKQLKPLIHIRNAVIEHYAPYFMGENIALKTVWYMHPDLEDAFSPSDYLLLCEMVRKEIGQIRVQEISIEATEEWLISSYPGVSQEQLWRRMRVLADALDHALKWGYCRHNPLRKAITDKYTRDRLFAQIRSALSKRHYTMDEMTIAFSAIEAKLRDGHLEYIGVMIRLLTGLESNIVCALRWKDLRMIPDYGFLDIVITRQVTNDGQAFRGFTALEDYRCVPCTSVLQKWLDQQKRRIESMVSSLTDIDRLPIVNPGEAIKDRSRRYHAYPPQELERISKEILALVGINEHIVQVPDQHCGGTKETNLNQYGGDFFRENFRYWALNLGKLTMDEVLYLIGNKPETTFGRYYCDYLSDTSQLMMFVKLQRWDAVFTESGKSHANTHTYTKTFSLEQEFSPEGDSPLQLQIHLTAEQGQSEIMIHAESKNGLSSYITPFA